MKRFIRSSVAASFIAVAFALPAASTDIELVTTVTSSFEPSLTGAGDSAGPFLSEGGRYILFSSTANNLCTTSSNTPFVSRMPAKLNLFFRSGVIAFRTIVSFVSRMPAKLNLFRRDRMLQTMELPAPHQRQRPLCNILERCERFGTGRFEWSR